MARRQVGEGYDALHLLGTAIAIWAVFFFALAHQWIAPIKARLDGRGKYQTFSANAPIVLFSNNHVYGSRFQYHVSFVRHATTFLESESPTEGW
jgi:hypothetical protein